MIRRIVTQNDYEGKSHIISDEFTNNIEIPLPHIDDQFKFFNLWTTDAMPVQLADSDPIKDKHVSTSPVTNGSMFRIVNYPPEQVLLDKIANMSTNELLEFEKTIGIKLDLNGKHPLMHITKSIDFGIVLSGEIHLVLEKEETLLKPFDTVIQRGTSHAWSNRSNVSCLMAYVLLDADVNGFEAKEDSYE
jgi:hypothetical protein